MSQVSISPGRGPWLLALHSSCETLGVGLQPLGGGAPASLRSFPLGRLLSNTMLNCVEELLPASDWHRLGRLAVATGPGGFTATRLSVAMARTLAQQLALPLDGVSSFQLIAQRLWRSEPWPTGTPFWLEQELPRRGWVAGLYQPDSALPGGVAELEPPRLFERRPQPQNDPSGLDRHSAVTVLPADVGELLSYSQAAHQSARPAPWAGVLPIYPTSPVDNQPC